MSITDILTFLLILSVLVFIHEAGHFTIAKLFKIKVQEFGIGFPPKLLGFTYRQTTYSLNALPFGGFVKLPETEIAPSSTSRLISDVAPWQRLCVLSAGPIMNIIFAIILFTALFMSPHDTYTGTIVITEISEDSPAYDAGLQAGDQVLAINGSIIDNFESIHSLINSTKGKLSKWKVQRGQNISTVLITPRIDPPPAEGPIGIKITLANITSTKTSYSLLPSIVLAIEHLSSTLGFIQTEVSHWIQGTAKPQLTGPIGIAQVTGEVAKTGLVPLIELTALLSLNLAILNILPIPMLDGGRMVFVLFEIVTRGKKVPKDKENMVHAFGLLLLVGIIILITFQDIARLLKGESILG